MNATTEATTSVTSVSLEVPDEAAAVDFYREAFGLGSLLGVRAGDSPSTGFRGFTLSLVVSQPGNVDLLVGAALEAGATTIKPVTKSFWGYGGTIRAPDGAIWKIATSEKKDTKPVSKQVDDIVLLLGCADVAATKQFYVERGLTVSKSFGRKYVEFAAPPSHVKLALYGYKALAKDAGVPAEGSGSHRIVIGSNAGSFTDPDGFIWEAA